MVTLFIKLNHGISTDQQTLGFALETKDGSEVEQALANHLIEQMTIAYRFYCMTEKAVLTLNKKTEGGKK